MGVDNVTAATRNIVVVSGGLGVPSTSRMLGDQIAEAAKDSIESLGGRARVEVIELREYAGEIASNMVSRYASPRLQEVIDQVADADALVAVSPVFTASVSGLFKSFLDVLDPKGFEGVPVIVAATGGSARHSMVIDYVMRPIFSYLKSDIMPTGVFAGPDDWGVAEGSGNDGGALTARAQRAGRELALALAAGASLPAPASADGGGPGAPGTAAPGGAGVVVPRTSGAEFGIVGDDEDLSADLTSRSIAPSRKDLRAEREAADMTSMPFEDLLASINGNRT
ncbi:CE1759 family FMN reductase [Zhihengliuella salsuginis]|uniref:NADPH-dependent FMN reductase-like domain-containing protein n=1 Tax=Zhihengliuella salsuginis TaxID=578222 RepID=A0ABQ3GJ56_9MICC|nr:CE1759 family FMN reductase [Zhihengliuella salsuginis]GHD09150.1 hypothetical protein GCM10008096_21520 [Zhihengliuella salsuginis]